MTLRPQSLPPVPEATVAAVQAAFPKGNLYVELHAEFGPLYDDQLFAELYPPSGRPVEVAPWRLALVVVMQYIEGLTDRQAADAVRRCMDWKYALSLELTDPGFDFTLLHDFRLRLLAHEAGQRFLDTFLAACKARGWIKARGTQWTDSTHVLAAIRTLHRLEGVLEAMHYALNQLSDVAPAWVHQQVPPAWYTRDGLRPDQARLPKDASKREVLACQIGADGYQLLEWVRAADPALGVRELPALEALRRIWLQQYYRCTVPGREVLRWRTGNEQPPSAVRIAFPYDLEARYSSKRDTQWTGYMVHVSETCEPTTPYLLTHVHTTPATVHEARCTAPIQQALVAKDVPPSEHLVDAAYIDAELLVQSQDEHGIILRGPTRPSPGWQAQVEGAYTIDQFAVDWDQQRVRCPQGKWSAAWWEHGDRAGCRPIIVQFAKEDCQACPARPLCTRAQQQGRRVRLPPQAQYEALEAARAWYGSAEGKPRYKRRAGIEGTLSQGVRAFGLRRTRYQGWAKTHLQHVATAAAINVERIVAWLDERPRAKTRTSRFAALAPASILPAGIPLV